MAIVVLQRYLLTAVTTSQVIGASSTQVVAVSTPAVPVSGRWTIRLAQLSAICTAQDNSSQLSLALLQTSWNLQTAAGVTIYQVFGEDSGYTPAFVFPKVAVGVVKTQNPGQIVSSVDQIGGVVSLVAGAAGAAITNLDSTNPHNMTLQVNAILEFALPGAS